MYTISFKKTIGLSILGFVLLFIMIVPVYIWMYGYESLKVFPDIPFAGSICLVVGIVFHEVIHFMVAAAYNKDGVKGVKLGFIWKKFTPYCLCKNPLLAWQYRLYLIMPFFLLGIIPILLGFLFNAFYLVFLGIAFSVGSTADLSIVYKIRKLSKYDVLQDSTEQCGCQIVDEVFTK